MSRRTAWIALMSMVIVACVPFGFVGWFLGALLTGRPIGHQTGAVVILMLMLGAALLTLVVVLRFKYLPRQMF